MKLGVIQSEYEFSIFRSLSNQLLPKTKLMVA